MRQEYRLYQQNEIISPIIGLNYLPVLTYSQNSGWYIAAEDPSSWQHYQQRRNSLQMCINHLGAFAAPHKAEFCPDLCQPGLHFQWELLHQHCWRQNSCQPGSEQRNRPRCKYGQVLLSSCSLTKVPKSHLHFVWHPYTASRCIRNNSRLCAEG